MVLKLRGVQLDANITIIYNKNIYDLQAGKLAVAYLPCEGGSRTPQNTSIKSHIRTYKERKQKSKHSNIKSQTRTHIYTEAKSKQSATLITNTKSKHSDIKSKSEHSNIGSQLTIHTTTAKEKSKLSDSHSFKFARAKVSFWRPPVLHSGYRNEAPSTRSRTI